MLTKKDAMLTREDVMVTSDYVNDCPWKLHHGNKGRCQDHVSATAPTALVSWSFETAASQRRTQYWGRHTQEL